MSVASKNIRNLFLIGSLGVALAACGGGGGGGGSSAGSPVGGNTGSGSAPATAPTDGSTDYALLTWDAPTTNEDGSCLNDLASYRISYGLAPGVYTKTKEIGVDEMAASKTGNSDACGEIVSYTFLVDKLDSASWYFAVQAVDADGNTSDYSNEVVKTIM